jgi:hypothetical protein
MTMGLVFGYVFPPAVEYVMQRYEATCDLCGAVITEPRFDMYRPEAKRYFRKQGWRISERRCLCPDCARVAAHQ